MAVRGSRRNLIDQRWIVIPITSLIDPPRHRPHAKPISAGWLKNFRTCLAAQPRPDIRPIGAANATFALKAGV
jgi:hypothetical protein